MLAEDRRAVALAYALGAAFYAAYAVARGQDANWDLQNYHDYDAFALLHWRYPVDVAPGGPQSYLNPLPYVLPYLLRRHLPPIAASVVLAMVQALVVPLAWALSVLVVDGRGRRATAVRVLATVAASTGAMTLSEVGTSFADVLLASLGLGALLATVRAGAEGGRQSDRLHALAGFLAGIATGLKLTNLLVVIGCFGALAIPWRGWARGVRAAGMVALGTVAGSALSGGWWDVYLWRRFASPTFPFLNSVFRSPSSVPIDYSDARFLPHGFADAVSYPFKIAMGLYPTSENAFRDWRFAVALPLCAVFVVLATARQARAIPSRRALLQVSAFLWTGFTAWLFTFAIQRYAVTFEIVAGLSAVAVVAALLPARLSAPGSALASLLILATTSSADWWHRSWSDAWAPRLPAAVSAAPAAFLMIDFPLGYWVSALPAGSRAYLLYPFLLPAGGVLTERFDAGLSDAPGETIWGVGNDVPVEPRVRTNMAAQGFVLASPCYRARSLWWVDTVFCRAVRVGSRPSAASDIRIGETVAFSKAGSGRIYEVSGWQPADGDSTLAEGPASVLALAPETVAGPLALEMVVSGVVGPSWPESEVDVSVPGAGQPARWVFHLGESWVTHAVCVPEAARRNGVVEVRFQALKPHSPRDAGVGPDDRSLSFMLRTIALRQARPGKCDG